MEWIKRACDYRTLIGKRDLLGSSLTGPELERLEELRQQFAGSPYTGRPLFNQREQLRAPVSALATFKSETGTTKGLLRDISGEGVFVETARPLPLGARTVVSVSDRATLEEWRFGAEVVRTELEGMGLRFVGIPVALRVGHRASERQRPLRRAA
jgi:hypothetical protein